MESIVDTGTVHFFQCLEADVLQEYLRSGIHYLVNAVLNAYPKLIPFRYYTQEITTLLDFIKDFYYLYHHQATYAENFYFLERKYQSPIQSKFNALKSALIWTIIPYLCTKIDEKYNRMVGEEMDGKRLGNLAKIFKSIYPYVYAVIGIIQVLMKMRYLLFNSCNKKGQPMEYSLLYKVDRSVLKHVEDISYGSDSEDKEKTVYPFMQLLKSPGLLVILMSHKVISWYFNQKNNRQANLQQAQDREKIIPPFPKEVNSHQNHLCPLCNKQLKNATMVRNSGYVYCYDCIWEYVRKNSKCPLSQLTCNQASLQIIYN